MKKAFKTLNCLLWPVVALTLLESWNLTAIFHIPVLWNSYLVLPEFVLKTFLKLAITAFVYGFLIDMASGQEILQTKALFIKNFRAFFKTVFLIFLLSYLIDFVLFVLLPGPRIPFDLQGMILSPLITLIWLKVVFARKSPKKIPDSFLRGPREWGIFAVLSAAYCIAYTIFFILPDQTSLVRCALIFFLKYLNLWIFLVLAYHIMERFSLRREQDPSPKEIYLINPPSGGIAFGSMSLIFHKYPFVFAILKALTPQGYVFREFNQVIWQENYYTGEKLVAITCLTSNCMEAYRIAKGFREKGSRVVMGGSHVTAFPEEALEFCDAVVVGPVEGVWPRVIEDYEAGHMQRIYSGLPTDEAYDKVSKFLLDQPPRIIADCLETARGCKFNCFFCGGGHSKTGHHRNSPDVVVELIRKASRHKRTLVFFDDNIYSDPEYAKELFRLIKPLKIRWLASSTLDIAKDPEALQLCKESGCQMLLIGYEIFPGSQEAKQGKFSLSDDYIKLSRIIQKQGIGIKAQLIYGFETDNFATFWKMWWFTLRLFPTISSMCILTPVPNSRFYQEIEKQDRFINLNWSKYGFFSLVHKHPAINNSLMRNGALFIVTFFAMTTSRLGMLILLNILGYWMLFKKMP